MGSDLKQNTMTKIEQIIEAAREYYSVPGNEVGGNLHIVLDDGNINNRHIEWCINEASKQGDEKGVALGKMLLDCSITQRKKVIKNYSKYCA